MVGQQLYRNRYVLSAASYSLDVNIARSSKLFSSSVVNTYEFVNPSPRKHLQRTSWNHWYLRDVVLCPSQKPELYSIYRCNVDKYDIQKQQSTRILGDLEFDPVSLAIGGDFIVVGGQRAELAVARLSDPSSPTVVRSGGSINNFDGVTNLNIMSSNDMPRLLVCNNDHTVRLMSLPDLRIVTELKFPTAVNYAAISPDGAKMCVVGDSNEVFLFNKHGDDFEKIATLTASNDASFSCDWNQSSQLFAVGSQDGYATVWDIRSQQKMVQLETFQHGRSRGACRNVKFSPSGSIDLLAFSEHTSYVNVVDTRSFEKRQILRADSPSLLSQDLQITGLRFSSDSSALFVGLEESILEYAVDRIGRYSFSTSEII
ncbi:WD40-repeat-containing domain protein [Coemansia spiralis]|nr:WD40-repeat-containing domain protein [Coemansia spiralis]